MGDLLARFSSSECQARPVPSNAGHMDEISSEAATIRQFTETDSDQVVALWRKTGLTREWNDPRADIERKQLLHDEMFFVAERAGLIVGTVMAGYDGHRGWIHYLAVLPGLHHTGLGRALIEAAEIALGDLGCPKVQLQVRPENSSVIGFYEHLGYARYEAINMGKRLVDDEASSNINASGET